MATPRQKLTPDSVVSCIGLVLMAGLVGAALWIWIGRQILPWLQEGEWHSYPLASYCKIQTDWVGLQIILDWVLKLPVTLVLALAGIFLFWAFGVISAKMYQQASSRMGKPVTPAQTRA